MADPLALARVKRFVLYGSEAPFCRCDKILSITVTKVSLTDCPTVVKLVETADGAARAFKQVQGVVESFKDSTPAAGNRYNKAAAFVALILIIKSPNSRHQLKRDAYGCLEIACQNTEELFLFHYHFGQLTEQLRPANKNNAGGDKDDDDEADNDNDDDKNDDEASPPPNKKTKRKSTKEKKRNGNSSGGMKRFMARWYNSRDPLALAADCTGVVHRHGISHAALIKNYRVKPKGTAMEIVFACIGVRGDFQCSGRLKKSMTVIVEKVEKKIVADPENHPMDDKSNQVLDYFKQLAQLFLLLKTQEGVEAETAKKEWKEGDKALKAAEIVKSVQVPNLIGIPCEFWHSPAVLEAIIPKMSVRDVLFHLPRLSVCEKTSSFPSMAVDPLTYLYDRERLAKERVDPFEVAAAMRRYECGKYHEPSKLESGVKKRKVCVDSWTVTSQAIDALCRSFDVTLELQPAFPAKRVLIAVDVNNDNRSKRVSGGLVGMNAESVIGLMVSILMNACGNDGDIVVKDEDNGPGNGRSYDVVAISQREEEKETKTTTASADASSSSSTTTWIPEYPRIDLAAKDSPAVIIKKMEKFVSSAVDVAALLNHCVKEELRYDAFIVLAGNLSTPCPAAGPKAALANYRKTMGVEGAKMCVVGVAAKMFTIADPDDHNSLDVLGMGASCVHQIRDFLMA